MRKDDNEDESEKTQPSLIIANFLKEQGHDPTDLHTAIDRGYQSDGDRRGRRR